MTNAILTAECFYDGSPVAYRTIMAAAPCGADDITAAVKSGALRLVDRKIGPGGQLLKGLDRLHVVPAWGRV